MAKLSLKGWKDPARRPRLLVLTGSAVVLFGALMVVALGVSSSYWFCANACHAVQDDTITAYDASSHSEVSCMACHMPVNADPVTFVWHKASSLGELYLVVTGNWSLPLNEHSHLAQSEEMSSEQCTQCHSENREITPTEGVIINHAIHEENGVHCTMCHNRVAHPEDFELTLEGNEKHEDFMDMVHCFRCHGLDEDAEAPGECGKCHPEGFELKPENHFVAGFYQLGGDSAGHTALREEEGEEYCASCHLVETFCSGCHGLEMPHPEGFVDEHGDLGHDTPEVCANCHGHGATGMEFCNSCHHEQADPTRPWVDQHWQVVRDVGATPCFDCHSPTYCAECHVRGLER